MRRTGWWALFGLLVILIAFDVLLVIIGIVDGARGQQSGGVGPAIVVVVVFLLVGVGLTVAARAVEHHVRLNHHPVGGRWGVPVGGNWSPSRPSGYSVSASPGPSTPPTTSSTSTADDIGGAVVPDWTPSPPSRIVRTGRPLRRRHSPIAAAFGYVALLALAIGFPIGTIVSYSDWRTSVYIQNHGVRSTLTVTEVIQIDHNTRSGNYKTINLDGTLSPPVEGRTQTTVYTPHDNLFFVSQTLTVLVDPHDTSRAELPGQRDHSVSAFVALLVFTVLLYAFGVSVVVSVVRTRRRRGIRPA